MSGRTRGVEVPSEVPCPVCTIGRAGPSVQFARSWWPTLTCPSCRTSFIWPLPPADELARNYEYARYGLVTYASDPLAQRRRVAGLQGLLEGVEARSGRAGTLVDLGCSTGDFLEAGVRRGWTVQGIELDPETARRTAERLGVSVLSGPAVEQLEQLGEFDLVVMGHWLEHIPAPGVAFDTAARHLAPGGHLLLRVPNADSSLARSTGVGWTWFEPGIHLFYFVPRSLPALAHRAGLELVESRTVRGDARPFPFEVGLAYFRLLVPRGRQGPGDIPPHSTRSARQRLGPILAGMAALERVDRSDAFRPVGRGPELIALFRRPT
jgi:SAM-dependent methyltransferase